MGYWADLMNCKLSSTFILLLLFRKSTIYNIILNPIKEKNMLAQILVHKTGVRGIQDTRQIVDGKTNDIENNDKKGGSKPLT